MKKLYHFVRRSISRRLFCYFAVLALISLLLQVVTLTINTDVSRRFVTDSTQTQVDSTLARLESVFDEAQTVSRSLQGHAIFQSRMRKVYNMQAELFSDELEANMELTSILSGHSMLSGVYLLGMNGFCCKSNAYSFLYSNYFSQSWYWDTVDGGRGIWHSMHDESLVMRTANNSFISYTEPYINRATGLCNGVIVTEINRDVLSGILAVNSTSSMFLLLDGNKELIYRTNADWATAKDIERIQARIGEQFAGDDQELAAFDLDSSLVICRRSVDTGWLLVGVVPGSYINRDGIYMATIGVACMLLVLLLGTWIAFIVSRSFTRPIIKVTNAMAVVEEGDLSLQLDVVGEDETAKLSHGFNHMVKQINRLMESIYEQQSMLRRSEFKALQSQINPHLLYNSLDSIAWLIRMKQLDDATMMLQSLSTLFRIALSKGHELVSIRSELKHLQSYIAIQSVRYSKKFTFDIHADEALSDYVTLKLMLQPLVENCIYHGLSVERPVIHIDVTVEEVDGDIVFRVSDDGAGMSEEKLGELRKRISELPNETGVAKDISGGYGLPNINGRVRIYFGKQYGMTIDSQEMAGTTVAIRIPKLKEAEL